MGLFTFARKKRPATTYEKLQRYALQAYGGTEDVILAFYQKVGELEIRQKAGNLVQQSVDIAGSMLRKTTDTVTQSIQAVSTKSLAFGNASFQTIASAMERAGITQSHLIFGLALVLIVVYATREIQRRNKQRQKLLYGDSLFPPYAPFTIFQTGKALGGIELPLFFQRSSETVGPIFRLKVPFWRGPMIVAVGDVDVAKDILQDETTTKPKSMYSSMASLVFGRTNILTSDGKQWKHARKGISPAFAKAHIDRMHKVCKERTEEWIQTRLEPAIHAGTAVDISEEFLFLTLSIICKTLFEYRIKDVEAKRLIADLEIATSEIAFRQVTYPWRDTLLSLVLPSVRRAKQARSCILKLAYKMLESYRRKPSNLRSQARTIIGCIEKNKNYQTDEDRIADMVMLLFAGHDTTAYSLAWILLELARHPKESSRLREALNGNDDMRAQGLLKDVLREGMRLRPVYPGIGVRTIGKDYYLQDKGIVIPKGSQILFPSMILTRYGVEDAEEFQPLRWTKHPNKSFLLFSSGSHHCAGKSLALAEMTWVLSRLCAQYKFHVADEGTPQFRVFWKCQGAKVQVKHA